MIKDEPAQPAPTHFLDQSLLEETAVLDEYDPIKPNEYEAYVQNGGHRWLTKNTTVSSAPG